MIINKSVPDISIPFLTGGAAALFASICLPPMRETNYRGHSIAIPMEQLAERANREQYL